MYLLSDILTYMRRILKTPSNAVITDSLLVDYVNRFWINDVDARIQLFDLKTKYQFITQPGVDKYNMPLYNLQIETPPLPPAGLGQTLGYYPVYQGFTSPAYINGIDCAIQTQKDGFYNIWPNIVQYLQSAAIGNGGTFYSFKLPILPAVTPPNPPLNALLRGHVDINGIISSAGSPASAGVNDPPVGAVGNAFNSNIPVTSVESRVFITTLDSNGVNVIVTDSGQFLTGATGAINYGLLMNPGSAPFGNTALTDTFGNPNMYSETLNTINYVTGQVNVNFPTAIPTGNNINVQCFYFQSGLPRAILFYNNVITLRNVPDNQYLVELDAFYTPAAYLNTTDSIQFGYMSEYIARGAARKILSDTGDWDQFNAYESLFIEQERLVWKRSQRQWTATRTESIYSQGLDHGLAGNTNFSGGTI